jgi:cyanophycinase
MRILLLLLSFLLGAPASSGTLVIAGGALSPDNAAVWRAFLAARPADRPGIVIVPAASGAPTQSAASTAAVLESHGARADDIRVLRLATEDDPGTPEDESRWAAGGRDPALVAQVAEAGAIWFVGGDQARITRVLLELDGRDTPLLAQMRQRLAAGAVIGGTSAGAAIMSPTMIARGDSLVALLEPVLRDEIGSSGRDGGPMALTRGLGFFPYGLVDQHFDRRARLGRLTRGALAASDRVQPPIGYGIDEDTALLVDLGAGTARPLGAGSVTLVDLRAASSGETAGRLRVSGGRLFIANAGDRITLPALARLAAILPADSGLADLDVQPARYKAPLAGRERDDHQVADGGGMALGGGSLDELVGGDLLDNRGTQRIERLTVSGRDGVLFRFAETAATRGWEGRDPDGRSRYTAAHVDFAILPVRVRVTPLKGR